MTPVVIETLKGSSLVFCRDRKSMNSLFQILDLILLGTGDPRGMPSLTVAAEIE
jgi:hypothetical protein